MRKRIALMASVMVMVVALYGGAFQVVEENESYLRIEFILPEYSIEKIENGNRIVDRIIISDGELLCEEGAPQLPYFAEALGLPVDGNLELNILSKSSKIIKNVEIELGPEMVLDGQDVNYRPIYSNDNSAVRGLYPSSIIENGETAYIGDRHFGSFQLFPFRYDSNKNELIVNDRIEFEIIINGDKNVKRGWQLSSNYIDKAGDSFCLNNSYSKKWRKEKLLSTEEYTRDSEENAIDFVVLEDGIYKITYEYLTDMVQSIQDSTGIPLGWNLDSINPQNLQLTSEDGFEPIFFFGEEDNSFDEGDYLEFYGHRHAGDTSFFDDYTSRNVYKLELIEGLGSRMAVENGGIMVTNSSQYIEPNQYDFNIHFEKQQTFEKLGQAYNSYNEFYKEDSYFWRKLTAPNLEIVPIELQYPKESNINRINVEVGLYGLSYSSSFYDDHHAIVRLNAAMIDSQIWTGQSAATFTSNGIISNSFLEHGTNNVYISLPGDTPTGDGEQVALDYIDITYWREYKTDEDYIKFKKPINKGNGLYQFKLSGFQSNDVSIYKLGSSKMENARIEAFFEFGGAPYFVTFQDSVNSNSTQYYATTEDNKKLPEETRIDVVSELKNPSNGYDCLIITKKEFIENEGTQLYKQLWEELGLSVLIVDAQDIYDEFNAGILSAEAIKDFLSYAYNNWSEPQLKSVFLIGDGTHDTRDNSTTEKYNIIPFRKIWTYKHGSTASDNWFGCIVGDDSVADIAIARISIWEPQQILDIAQKSFAHIKEPDFEALGSSSVVLAAGGKVADGNDIFSVQEETIRRRMISDDYRVARVYTTTQTVNQGYYGSTFSLKDNVDKGASFLQFMGHGGGRIWADYNLLNFNDISTLNNDYYPFVSSLACYASSFDYAGSSCISEAFVSEPGKGAINTVGFSGLGYLVQDLPFGTALADGYFRQDFASIGEVVSYTKAKFFVKTSGFNSRLALTAGCVLIGDPNVPIYKPTKALDVSTDKELYAKGDTIRVTMISDNPEITKAKLFVIDQHGLTKNITYYLPVILGEYNASYVIPEELEDGTFYRVRVESFDSNSVLFGETNVAVGSANFSNITLNPAEPTIYDSVSVEVNVIAEEPITSVNFSYRLLFAKSRVIIPMELVEGTNSRYITTSKIPKQLAEREVIYKFESLVESEEVIESVEYNYVTLGPDIAILESELIESQGKPAIKIKVKNIGTAKAEICDMKVERIETFGSDNEIVFDDVFQDLEMGDEREEVLLIDEYPTGDYIFRVILNQERIFSEISYSNNSKDITIAMNYQVIPALGGAVTSLDGNAQMDVPANYSSEETIFNIRELDYVMPNEQPDISTIKLLDGSISKVYEIEAVTPNIADSTQALLLGNMDVSIKYLASDSLTNLYANNGEIDIYRWNENYEKWIYQGGLVSFSNGTIRCSIPRLGKFTLLRNRDNIRPSIDPNVQEQEFTQGGYISGKGTISVILSDANGIDILDNRFNFFLNGEKIEEENLVVTVNGNNLNNIPIKYHLDLAKGDYTLVVDCTDINGNFNSLDINFKVNNKFDIVRVANYPNPVIGKAIEPVNDGRTRFTYTLTDDATDVKIKVYTVSGRVVKTFKNMPNSVGYHEYPRGVYGWDCKDDAGFDLANGVYFYKIIAKKGSKKIEKIMKMAILK
ncbi:MAG: hypothetical protein B6226_00990 [Candidatus Cloacimonetes bacterium 4572_65]|nr:MAG: hypothetical protein B6226_00990 [Candidatus Cloacimonetes bacterium 4572_65]